MKNFSIRETVIAFVLCIALMAIGALWATHTFVPTAEADATAGVFGPGTESFLVSGGALVQPGQIAATTSKHYFTAAVTASSTLSGYLGRSNQIDLKVRAIASSSAAILRFTVLTSDNNTDFYPIDFATTTTPNLSMVTSGAIVSSWSLATSTSGSACAQNINEVCKDITIRNVYSRYFKILISVEGANAAVWAKAFPLEFVR